MNGDRTSGGLHRHGPAASLRAPGPVVVYPSTRWPLTTWLSSASRAQSLAVQAELTASMFRRITSLVQSAIVTVLITAIAAFHQPTATFKAWLIVDSILVAIRLSLVAAIWAVSRGRLAATRVPVVDLFILGGIIWCLVLGSGAGLCIASGDPALGTLGSFLAMGTVGGLAARNPGTPRITIIQMFLIIVPMACSAAMAPTPVVGWIVVLAPFYLTGMVSINQQLHEDFVELILSRIENRYSALHCPLTKLPNRTFFEERLSEVLETAKLTGEEAFVLCLDLDGFKNVNDDYGHLQGDQLLVQTAARISGVLGPNDIAARLGGDEFAVIAIVKEPHAAEGIAAAIVASLAKPFRLDNVTVRMSVSVGLARAHRGIKDAYEVLAQADLALYAAKRGGKGSFRWFKPQDGANSGLHAA